jgi:hypothetical protein
MMHCAGCGYPLRYHEVGTTRCPADEGFAKTAKYRDPPPIDRTPWREIMRRDYQARVAKYEAERAPYVPVVIPPPRIPARAPEGPHELAGYGGRQAVGLGRKAVAAGWQVSAHYAMRHDGEEFCAVKMQRDDLFAVATWTRKPGKQGTKSGWEADIAYGVRRGDAPVKLSHTQLEGVITT